MLTEPMLRALWPHGDAKVPGLIAGIVAAAPAVFAKYGLTGEPALDRIVVAHAMAQFSHESGAGLEMIENIRFSAERACQVWPSRFRDADDCYRKVGSFRGDPEFHIKLIDSVYGGRLGNRPGTHDGSTFIGRGLSQCTGRENYERLGKMTGLDLVAHPEFLSDPAHALECGVADFIMCGCLPFAKRDDVREVTHRLNGGYIGLAERKEWLVKWKKALATAKAAAPVPPPPDIEPPLPTDKPAPVTVKEGGAGAAAVAGAVAAHQGGAPWWMIFAIAALAAIAAYGIVHFIIKERN